METHMDIYNIYKDEPFFQLKMGLNNDSTLFVKWNVFKDKKDDNKPVMRTRYVLLDKNNERISLKTLKLTEPVKFKQIEVTETLEEILDAIYQFNDRELLISTHFGEWINSELIKMIQSGGVKITSIQTDKNGCKKI